ncbi:MAG TPA: hypothetical protein VGL02_03455 [Streptomyces sp.]
MTEWTDELCCDFERFTRAVFGDADLRGQADEAELAGAETVPIVGELL